MTRLVKRFTLSLLLVVGVGWVAAMIWGSPWMRLSMPGRVAQYLGERYPETQFALTGTTYDFLNRRYVARVRSDTDPVVTATVTLDRRGRGHDDYRERKVEAEMVAQLQPVVQAVLPEATVKASVILREESRHGDDIAYSPDLDGSLAAVVSWDLSATEPLPFVEQASAVLVALRQSALRVDDCLFWGDLGDRSYSLGLTKAQMALPTEQLLPLVNRPGKW